jgi:hypothetical protein
MLLVRHILLIKGAILSILLVPSMSYAAADAIMGVETATGVPELLTPAEAATLIGPGGLPATPIATDETDPVKIYGLGGEAGNGWQIGQDSSGNPFMNCYKDSVSGNCDYYRKLNSGKKGGFKDSSGNIDFEYSESSGEITAMTVNAETSGVNMILPFRWDLDLCALSPADSSTGHVWNKDPLSTSPTLTARTGTNRGTCVATFPDVDGDYGVQITRQIPDGTLTGNFDMDIWWDTTGTGNARFQVQTKCYADDEADDASFNTASVVTAAAGTSGRPNKQTLTGITITGCAGGELLRLRVYRNRTEGSDTLNAALNIEKIVFKGRVIE